MVWVVSKPCWTLRKGVSLSSAAHRQRGGQFAGALGVLRHDHAPSRVGHAHDVVAAGADLQAVAGEGAGADVEDAGQALARNEIKHRLHQDQPLAGGKVGDAPAGDGKAFGGRGRRALTFRFHEERRLASAIGLPLATAWAKFAPITVDDVMGKAHAPWVICVATQLTAPLPSAVVGIPG